MATLNLPQMIGEREIQLAAAKADYKALTDQYNHAVLAWAFYEAWFVPSRELLLAKALKRPQFTVHEGTGGE